MTKQALTSDYSLNEWLSLQSFNKHIPDSKVPIKLQLQDTKGVYKGKLVLDESKTLSFDDFAKYPLANDWFKKVLQGQPAEQTITFQSPKMKCVFKSDIKNLLIYIVFQYGDMILLIQKLHLD